MEDYTKKAKDGVADILSVWAYGGDRCDVIFKERNETGLNDTPYGIGFGYDFETGEWNSGHYGFKTERDAFSYLKKEYGSDPIKVKIMTVYKDEAKGDGKGGM